MCEWVGEGMRWEWELRTSVSNRGDTNLYEIIIKTHYNGFSYNALLELVFS